MSASLGHKILRAALWTAGGLVALAVIVPALLYVPFIQDFAKGVAVREASKATGMDIAVDRLRLRWPLRLSVDGVSVIEAGGDTMLTASRLDVGVKMLPLLKGDIDVNYARLDSAFYQMGNADSLMWLRARIERLEVHPSRLKINMEEIDLGGATLDGADVRLTLRPDTAAAPPDTATQKPMTIRAHEITLRRVRYSMSMLPTIDSLGCDIASARLADGTVDLQRRKIHARALSVDSVLATYLTPSARWLKENPLPAAAADTAATPADRMWTVTADTVSLTGRRATYAMRDARPLPGLDMSYLEASGINIAVTGFYNRGPEVTVPLQRLEATERCGLRLSAKGTFAMTTTAMKVQNFRIDTNGSWLNLDAMTGIGDLTSDPTLPLSLKADGRLALSDAVLAMPSLRAIVSRLPAPAIVNLDADISGTPRQLAVRRLSAVYPGLLRLAAEGLVDSPFDVDRIGGEIAVDGRLTPTAALNRSLTAARLLPGINLPRTMTVKGDVTYHPGMADADLVVTANDGRVALRGWWNGKRESYDAKAEISRFPVQDFLPALGVADLSAAVSADGSGYNPLSPATRMHVTADVTQVTYNRQPLHDITLDASVASGNASGVLASPNPLADLRIAFDASLADTGYVWNVDGDVRHLDLLALGVLTDTCAGTAILASKGSYNPRTRALDADLSIDSVNWLYGGRRYAVARTDLHAALTDSTAAARLANGDLTAAFSSGVGIEELLRRFTATGELVNRQIATRNVDIDSLQRTLPPFTLMLEMGRRNLAAEYLAGSGTGWQTAALTASNDSLISLTGAVTGFVTGTTRLDSINLTARQHGAYLVYGAMINNRPGTMDEFAHVTLNGFLGHDRLAALLNQRNINDETGYRLGFSTMVSDSTVSLRFVPYTPTIAYRKWSLNRDNHINYNLFTHRLDADLTLTDSISSLRLYTDNTIDSAPGHEDVVLQLRDIRIQDWLSLSPWAPPMKGDVSADMRVHLSPSVITGNGTINLDDFFYNNKRVGTFDIDVDVNTDPKSGMLRADMALMVDSVKTVTVSGTLNDSVSKSPFLLDFNMIRFPLRVANPFLPEGVARLGGMLNGRLDISGDMAHPVFNGWLNFDSTVVNVTMLGTDFRFSDKKIPVDSGIVTFDNFAITACNDNPLLINGTADLRDVANVGLDLALRASNMMIVNSSRAKNGADAYGKGYIDLNATVAGNMQMLRVDANAALLSGSNVTYVLPPSTSTLSSASTGVSDMVHFVSFNDSLQVAKADTVAREMALILNAGLDIQEGTTITVNITPDASSKAQVQGSGNFAFLMSPVNAGRLTGKYTISKGMARYNVPMLGEKSFDLLERSSIGFTGDMMNPQLNLHAVDRLKANVTQTGQNSRVITFDVSLDVTGTLQTMNVVFDLSTDDDITVENELQTMSPEQRANQAMNLLLYNTYTGPGTSANANLSGNPLYSFLESKLNTWMANTVKGVDISFGIDQYDRTLDGNTSSTMSYSYQVSKSLFNDRFKILVGGNYSTDANADENFSQNLISDISFEYLLNRSGSMYIRIFRHTGYESILEGEITQTGVGFVFKRKLDSLRDLFRLRRKNSTPTLVLPDEPSPQNHDEKKAD